MRGLTLPTILLSLAMVALSGCLGGSGSSSASSASASSFEALVDQQFSAGRVHSDTAVPVQIDGHSYPDSTTSDPHAYDALLAAQQ